MAAHSDRIRTLRTRSQEIGTMRPGWRPELGERSSDADRASIEALRRDRDSRSGRDGAAARSEVGRGDETGALSTRSDHGSGRDREEFNRRLIRIAQQRGGSIPPSEWQEHRQDLIDARRGRTGNTIDRDRTNDGVEFRDRGDFGGRYDEPRFGRDFDRNEPESFEVRPRSPIGPTEIGRGYLFQHDTRNRRYHEDAGHHYYDDRWHDYPKEHRHHDGCGHHYYDNDWHRWPRGHRHDAGCGHYYYDGDWFDYPRGHRHGPHCGHHYYDGVWHNFPKSHRHGHDCGHHYYDGYWYYWPRTHRHYAGCGHYYFNFFWYPFPPTYYGYQETVIISSANVGPATSYVDVYEEPARDHAARGYDKAQRGDYYGAIAAFSTAIATTADNGPLYLAQGLAYMQVGDYRSAYNKIMEGLRRTPDLATGHPDLQGLIADPEHVEWRILELMDAIDAAPDNERPILVLGYLQFLKGDYEGAKLALQAVAGLDPSNEESRRLLEFIYEIENEDGGRNATGA